MDCQTGPALNLRWLRTADVPIVWPLMRSSTARPWTRRSLADHLCDHRDRGLWVEESGQAIAVLLYRCDLQTLSHELVDMGVRRDRRRRSIGRGLMAAFQ